ncbi:hypothetical protein HYG86_17890 [Alkalicella caledoniensis]|uniref:Uncharacterized protein n=1 Tax=Alkalicella caledoniensis TaxID=2731377 RepID=A0A7G9WCU7_ALKCA|nr:hypothetical protein [Alkalicella caledoniensis]QNO16509.1 hypothetical protein HYG86_17890 [Alkalicella caledoniensis]
MKKLFALMLVSILALSLFAGCSSDNEEPTPGTDPVENNETVKVGLGSVSTLAKSRDAEGETTAQAQVDTTIAAASFDSEGRVLTVAIDVAQARVAYDDEMQITTDTSAEVKSKLQLGDAYNMKPRSEIGKEWYEQMAELEAWMIGKTVAEIKAMDLEDNRPADADLTSSVTITVDTYIAALEKAYANAVEVENVDKVGLGVTISIAKSRSASEENTAQAQVDSTFSATAVDADGKVVATFIDVAQVRVAFDEDGAVTNDRAAELKTKYELGDAYNMKPRSEIGKEWDEQMAELEAWMIGKTISEIKGMDLEDNRPADADLTSSVTITVDTYILAVDRAVANGK